MDCELCEHAIESLRKKTRAIAKCKHCKSPFCAEHGKDRYCNECSEQCCICMKPFYDCGCWK